MQIWAVMIPSDSIKSLSPKICFDITTDKIMNYWKSVIREVKQEPKFKKSSCVVTKSFYVPRFGLGNLRISKYNRFF